MVQTPEMWAKRSMLLKAIRFDALRRSTLSWCRRTRISASNRALDRNSMVSAHASNLRKLVVGTEHRPIRGCSLSVGSLTDDKHHLEANQRVDFVFAYLMKTERGIQRPFSRAF
jgi:hypothetical protein